MNIRDSLKDRAGTQHQRNTRPLIQRFRSLVIDSTSRAMGWVSEHITTDREDICWIDHLRWFLEGQFGRVFSWAYEGSDEEIESVWNNEIPLTHMNARQRSVLPDDLTDMPVHCSNCGWEGIHAQTEPHADHCPECAGNIWLEL